MTTIHELIERVEKLTGPDREVDALIHVFSGYATDLHVFAWTADPAAWRSFGARANHAIALRHPNEASHYTASIDAALTLARDQREVCQMLTAAHRAAQNVLVEQLAGKSTADAAGPPELFHAIRAALVRALRARAEQEKV